MRAFIAVEMPARFGREAAGLSRQLERLVEGRFMDPASHHVTLAFLGDVDDAGRAGAMDAMDAACAGCGPVPIASDGLGTFGKPRDATLWLGVRPDGRLLRLAGDVRAGLEERGVPFDRKPFRPHVTLARRARLPQGELPPLAFPHADEADAVTLFKSELSHRGATYKPLYSISLR